MSETIDQIVGNDGGLVTRYVLIAEVVDPEGVESLRIRTSEGLADWVTLGFLAFTDNCIRTSDGGAEWQPGPDDEADQ